MTPALHHLLACLDAFDRPSWVTGTCSSATADLAAPKQAASFGDGTRTRVDPAIRNGLKLKRANASVPDLATICAQIEDAFALDRHVIATLADVLVYPTGGLFARHKDTPRDLDQLGTLIVELPSPHLGGALVLHDGDERIVIDWSRPATTPRWVAIYGDLDHEIERVLEGQRNCITYRLTLGAKRSDPVQRAGLEAIADAIVTVMHDPETLAADRPVLIPCRRLIVDTVETRPLPLDALRGEDRAIGKLVASLGLGVTLEELLLFPPQHHSEAFPDDLYELQEEARKLIKRLPRRVFEEQRDLFTLAAETDVSGEDLDVNPTVHALPGYASPESLSDRTWLIRRAARATHVTNATYSEDGYFGNVHWEANIYRAAVLEVKLPSYGITARQVTRADLPALAALQSAFTEAQLAAQFFEPGRTSLVFEAHGQLAGGAAWLRSDKLMFVAPMIAPTFEVAMVILDRARRLADAWHRDIRVGCAPDETEKRRALEHHRFRHVLDLVTYARAPEAFAPEVRWRHVPLRDVDAEQLRAIHNETLVHVDNAPPLGLDDAQYLRDRAWAPGSGMWFDRDRPVAFVVAEHHDRVVEIAAIGVRVDYRHQGLARALTLRVVAAAASIADEVTAMIASTNHGSLELHRACGFTPKASRAIYELARDAPA